MAKKATSTQDVNMIHSAPMKDDEESGPLKTDVLTGGKKTNDEGILKTRRDLNYDLDTMTREAKKAREERKKFLIERKKASEKKRASAGERKR
eukprot:8950185-Ditylum_brightwellii.AAC.1